MATKQGVKTLKKKPKEKKKKKPYTKPKLIKYKKIGKSASVDISSY